MEAAGGAGARSGGGGGGGGPAPFLLKTYEMVDDPSTDAVVSWSDASDASFVVWNHPEFAARLLPTYFKHSNFSSFIRQLNTYGFHKIDPDRWEFGNEYFVKGQKHLLKNIHRRKPIHSHSHQPGALPDNERAILEDEIDRLSREKTTLQADLWKFKQQQSGAMTQIEDLEQRVLDMEQRQAKMISFLEHASKNPHFVNKLVKLAEASSIFTDAFHKKRRLPVLEYGIETTEATSFYDDHSRTSKQDMGNLLNQHFSDKLRLGLCPTMTDNIITLSNQSSHEDNGSPHGKHPEDERTRTVCLPLVPQMMELSDTGTSMCPSKNSCFTPAVNDEGLLSCHLSLTLASCSMNVDRNQPSDANVSAIDHERDFTMDKDDGTGRGFDENQNTSANTGAADASTPRGDSRVSSAAPAAQASTEALAAPPVVVNDKFWEQFLTERPGCSEAEEASSGLRRDPSREQMDDDNRQVYGHTPSDREDVEQLKL